MSLWPHRIIHLPIKTQPCHNQIFIMLHYSSSYYYVNHVFIQFSDAVNRIECYREMLLSQTSMLGVQPLMDIAKYIKKAKVRMIIT